MTTDIDGRQGLIDFSALIAGRRTYRKKIRADQAVPPELVKRLDTAREICGFTMKAVADSAKIDQYFVCRVLSGKQKITPEDFNALKLGFADLMIDRVLELGGRS